MSRIGQPARQAEPVARAILGNGGRAAGVRGRPAGRPGRRSCRGPGCTSAGARHLVIVMISKTPVWAANRRCRAGQGALYLLRLLIDRSKVVGRRAAASFRARAVVSDWPSKSLRHLDVGEGAVEDADVVQQRPLRPVERRRSPKVSPLPPACRFLVRLSRTISTRRPCR